MKSTWLPLLVSVSVLALTNCRKDQSIGVLNPIEKKGFYLTFNDEFSDSLLNRSKWIPNFRWGNGSYKAACYLEKNLSIERGNLIINAQREDCECGSFIPNTPDRYKNQFSSGMICSSEFFRQVYGFFEIRCKTPAGNGLWPAFWLMALESWPPEIDVAEFQGSNTRKVNLAYSCKERYDGDSEKINVSDCSAGFHTYAVEWDKEKIIWYYDNQIVKRTFKNIPGLPMYIIINLQVNDNGFAGYVDQNTKLPAEFIVDYIRVYRKKN